jgi:hypothetical protein
VLGVLIPRESASISIAEIRRYASGRTVSQEKVWVQGSTLVGLIELLAIDRKRISEKTKWLRVGYVVLGLALLAVAGLGVILGLNDARLL